MQNYHQGFFKKIIKDYISFLKAPKTFLEKQLESFDVAWIDQKWIAFVFFMHVYFIFNPVVVVGLNLVAIVYTYLSVGIFYYLSQICLEHYQENIGQENYDSKKLYVFAYVFALAELTGLFLHLIIAIFNLSFFFSIFGWLIAFFLTVPVILIVIALKLSMFRVVKPEKFSLETFFGFFMEAVLETFKNKLGLEAWQELWGDYSTQTLEGND